MTEAQCLHATLAFESPEGNSYDIEYDMHASEGSIFWACRRTPTVLELAVLSRVLVL
jgi:hypothetical protein